MRRFDPLGPRVRADLVRGDHGHEDSLQSAPGRSATSGLHGTLARPSSRLLRPTMILSIVTILLAAIANAQESPVPEPATQPAGTSNEMVEESAEMAPEAASPDISTPKAPRAESNAVADSEADDRLSGPPGVVAQFTTGVENREPIDHVTFVENDAQKVFFFSELRGLEGESILHRWIYDGRVQAEVRFDVRGPRWRVWSSKKLLPNWIGDWTVEIVLDNGEVIAAESFTYSAPQA